MGITATPVHFQVDFCVAGILQGGVRALGRFSCGAAADGCARARCCVVALVARSHATLRLTATGWQKEMIKTCIAVLIYQKLAPGCARWQSMQLHGVAYGVDGTSHNVKNAGFWGK